MFTRLAIFMALLALMVLVVWRAGVSKAEVHKKRVAYKVGATIAFANAIYAIIAALTLKATDSNAIIFKCAFVIIGVCMFVLAFSVTNTAKRKECTVTQQQRKKPEKKTKLKKPKNQRMSKLPKNYDLAKIINQLQGLYLNSACPADIPLTSLLDELKTLKDELKNIDDEYSGPMQALVYEHLPDYLSLFREFLATISSNTSDDQVVENEKEKLKKRTNSLLDYIGTAREYQRKKGKDDRLDQQTIDFESRLKAEASVIKEELVNKTDSESNN